MKERDLQEEAKKKVGPNQGSSPQMASKPKTLNNQGVDSSVVRSRNSGSGIKKSSSSNQSNGSGTFNENDTFNKHYNKELRVSKDEIPIVLAELNDNAISFIKKEQYDKALNLLQKAYGIMDVVDFNVCKRDKFHIFVLFHNMALCYQKMQMLEECASCIEQTLEYVSFDQFNLKERSISNRMRKLQMFCKLKMQYCAILSQIHRHKDALKQAKEGVRLSHQLVNDLRSLCQFYTKREEIEQSALVGISKNVYEEASLNYNSYTGGGSQDRVKKIHSSRNKSFGLFLSQKEQSRDYDTSIMQNAFSTNQYIPHHSQSNSLGGGMAASVSQSLSQFYTANYLEESMSYLERTAKKLLPILNEIKKRMIREKKRATGEGVSQSKEKQKSKKAAEKKLKNKVETLEINEEGSNSENEDGDSLFSYKEGEEDIVMRGGIDMKNILGYLNQGEWTQTLSIGSIMQLQPLHVKELLEQGKNEMELTRESFISKVSFLGVSYFCYSTEIRFILQMNEEPSWNSQMKHKESEFWHAKSLEIACTFLPGECPLLNHINLSYQKHFAPVKQTILEEEANEDDLKVVKPMPGIDNQKFQPIIRQVQNIKISITPYQMTPINAVTKPFLSQMIEFNDYQEQQINQASQITSAQGKNRGSLQQQNVRNSNNPQEEKEEMKSPKKDSEPNSKGYEGSQDNLQLVMGDLLSILMLYQRVQSSKGKNADEIVRFERAFNKLVTEKNLDRDQLLSQMKQIFDSEQSQSNTNTILKGIENGQFNDVLLDEHILGEEDSQEEGIEEDPDMDDQQIAIEAIHQSSQMNNMYKFRNQDINSVNDRPHTSNGVLRSSSNGVVQHQNSLGNNNRTSQTDQLQTNSTINQATEEGQNSYEQKKNQKGNRPLSGGGGPGTQGIQKIKTDSFRSRINKMNQNYSQNEKQVVYNQTPDKGAGNIKMSTQAPQTAQPPHKGHKSSQNKSFEANAHQQLSNAQKLQGVGNSIVQQNIRSMEQQKMAAGINSMSHNAQAYDELKRRLLNEYKKLCTNKKSFDDQIREKYKSMQQQQQNPGQVAQKIQERQNSAKKSSSHHHSSSSQSKKPHSGTQNPQLSKPNALHGQQQSFGNGNTQGSLQGTGSPKHHLNVYKPTFIINNSVTNENQIKEIDFVDQFKQKYRPSSKTNLPQGSTQNNQSRQINNSLGGVSQGQSLGSQHERGNSQYANAAPGNNQQLIGFLMGGDKKQNNSGRSSKRNKGQGQMHSLSQGSSNDMQMLKQFLVDKTNSVSKQQQTQQNANQNIGQNLINNPQQNNFQMHQKDPSYINQQQKFIPDPQLYLNQSSGQHKKQNSHSQIQQVHHQSRKSGTGVSTGAANQLSKLTEYEKLKKKLNY